jgi:hypothetical protein
MARTKETIIRDANANYDQAQKAYDALKISASNKQYKMGKEQYKKAKSHMDKIFIRHSVHRHIGAVTSDLRIASNRKMLPIQTKAFYFEKKIDAFAQKYIFIAEKRDNVENLIQFWAK